MKNITQSQEAIEPLVQEGQMLFKYMKKRCGIAYKLNHTKALVLATINGVIAGAITYYLIDKGIYDFITQHHLEATDATAIILDCYVGAFFTWLQYQRIKKNNYWVVLKHFYYRITSESELNDAQRLFSHGSEENTPRLVVP